MASTQPTNHHESTKSSTPPPPQPVDFTSNAPTDLPTPPFIAVAGVPNFRELGGYACHPRPYSSSLISPSSTPILRRKYLFRCAQLSQITPDATSLLTTTLGITTLYDLRSQPEIDSIVRSGLGVDVAGITRHFVPVYKDEDYSPVALARKYEMYTRPEDEKDGYSRGFVEAYSDILHHAVPAYRLIFTHILERPDEPLIFHCTAGKDRTGVFAAIVLRLLGVADESIIWDYALTERGLGEWRTIIVERMMKGSGGGGFPKAGEKSEESRLGMSREQAERIVGSRAMNMRMFLSDVLDKEFGGAYKCVNEHLGFSAEQIEGITRNLVEEGTAVVPPEGFEKDGAKGGMGLSNDRDGVRENKVMTG